MNEVERYEQANAALALLREDKSYREIAECLGLKSKGHAYRIVSRALAAIPAENLDAYRAEELGKLDEREAELAALFARLEKRATESEYALGDPEDKTVERMLKTCDALDRIHDRRVRLLGLVQQAPIVQVNNVDVNGMRAEMRASIERMLAGAAPMVEAVEVVEEGESDGE